ncbi:hypothetical protein Avbf_11224 [Armadillidium vulgare]|nr:hypothetical protein Avbf_11224 [Armadillidium vulgare]
MDSVSELMTNSAKRILSISSQMNEEDLNDEEVKSLSTSLTKEYDKLSQLSVDFVQRTGDELVHDIRASLLTLGELCLELIKKTNENRSDETESEESQTIIENISTQVKNITNIMRSTQEIPSPKQRAYNNAIREIENILESFREEKKAETYYCDGVLSIYLQSIMKKVWVSYEILKMVIANIASTESDAVTVSLRNFEYSLRRTAEEIKIYGSHAEPEDYKEILESMEESFLNIINFLRTCEEFQEENLTTFARSYLKISCSKSVQSLKILSYKISRQPNFDPSLSFQG